MSFSSRDYWEDRYKNNGNSGAGSYNEEAKFKAEYVNKVIDKYNIKTINDFGCGDSNQIRLFNPNVKYFGYDVSSTALLLCRNNLKEFINYSFVDSLDLLSCSDICFSIDVIYHLVEDLVFENYMKNLFNLSLKYVLIYSTNNDDPQKHSTYHSKGRLIVDYISENFSNFTLIDCVEYPPKNGDVKFYLYLRKEG